MPLECITVPPSLVPITPHLDANCLEFGHTLAQSLESEVEPGEEACGSLTDASSKSPDQAPAPFYGRWSQNVHVSSVRSILRCSGACAR